MCKGEFVGKMIEFDECVLVGVVFVVGGYLGSYDKGDVIIGFEEVVKLDGKVFYVGIVF